MLQHLNCMMVKECDLVFDSHMSGFVYKVRVNGEILVKKEIPGSEVVEEFLYEIHALHSLQDSDNVIRFRGLVTDDESEIVKGLLIDYCPKGALIDRIYDDCKTTYLGIPWRKRERWARQIIHGVADIHESGFVQGDLTLANVVLDDKENAKIIDVNRRGCPVGWEAPEAKALVDANQRLALYIGVKSDLFQLGMLLWALAMEEDEPESQGRPLLLGPEVNIPDWYRQITEICLSHDPRSRLQATQLLTMIPDASFTPAYSRIASRPAVEHCESPRELSGECAPAPAVETKAAFYPQRGRSPPSPMPSDSSRQQKTGWAANIPVAASYDDMAAKAKSYLDASRNRNSMPTPEYESLTQQQQQPQPPQQQQQQRLGPPLQQPQLQRHSPIQKLRSPVYRQESPKQLGLISPRSNETERSFLDDASKASATPPASMASMLPPPPPLKQPITYLNSADSGIFMRSNSEETVAYPSSPSKPKDLAQRINDELLEDLERNGAAKSVLQAIFGQNAKQSAGSQDVPHEDKRTAVPQTTSNGDHVTAPHATFNNGDRATMPRASPNGDRCPSGSHQTRQTNHDNHAMSPKDSPNGDTWTKIPRNTSNNDNRTVTSLNGTNNNWTAAPEAIANNSSATTPKDGAYNDGWTAVSQESTNTDNWTAISRKNSNNAHYDTLPQDNNDTLPQDNNDDNASVAASFISRTSSPDGDLEGGAQLGRSDTAFSAVDTHFARPAYPIHSKPPLTTIIDTPVTTLEHAMHHHPHAAHPALAPSKLSMTTILETPVTTLEQHTMQQHHHHPHGAHPTLRPGQGIAAPLLADLNPDIHFDSALWPDATRRFMTGAKS